MNCRQFAVILIAAAGLCSVQSASAALKVLACEPEWAALTQELGGDKATVYSATTARQDPHQIQARPSLIARARNADLVVCTGAELEIGWLPVLLRQSGNAKVQPGQPGYFEAADFVRKLDVPAQLDRAQGDVHAARQPAHPDRPAQHRAGGRRAGRAAGADRSRRTRPQYAAAPAPTSAALAAGDRALGSSRPRRCGAYRSSSQHKAFRLPRTTGSA